MKRKFTLFTLLFLLVAGVEIKAQTVLWSENFNSGTSRYFTLNTADDGCALNPRNAWAINNDYIGTDGTVQGEIYCNEIGGLYPVGYNNMSTPSEPLALDPDSTSYYLHILDTSCAAIGVYNASWLVADNVCVQTQNSFVRMDTDISTIGLDSVTLKFWWICHGGPNAYGGVYYSTNGGTTWTQITTPITKYNLSTAWAQQSIYLPAFDNQAQLRFGFIWVSGTGTRNILDPSFALDDISIEVPTPPTNTITTGAITGSPFCACSTVKVPFTSTGTFTAGNTYTAQLSSATGSFAAPVTIGSNANDTLSTDTISATIPCNTATGSGYRIRVISSAPAVTGTDNGVNITINAQAEASVIISANPGNNICAGSSVTFTATPTNGGATPSYQWKVNGGNAGTNSNTFTSDTLSNGDVVTCVLTSDAPCVTGSPAPSNALTMTVTAAATASVNITASPSGAICAGTSVLFTAKPTNGGSTPSYQWQVNSSNAGANADTFSSAALTNGAQVTCIMTSNAACVTGSPATSNTVTMTVNAANPASVSIAAAPAGAICPDASVTFTATPTNGGATPSYQWKVNGVDEGTSKDTFSSSSLTNGEVVTCILTSNATCVTGSPATSNTITMTVNAANPASVSITALPSGAVCAGTSVTFTATPTNGGATPSYQWKVNGIDEGTSKDTFSSSSLTNGEVVTCVLTSNATCVTGSPATSNTVTMTVNAANPASVSIAAAPAGAICPGASVTFTATPTNGGATPSYQWKVNGIDEGTSKDTFSSSSLTNGEVVTCVLTSNASCVTGSPATSNTITMTVNAANPASVSIAAAPAGAICPGASVTFTATPTNGGTTPSYQWKVNGIDEGTSKDTFSSSSLTNGEVVTCVLTSNASCVTGSPATSNGITMAVNPTVTASVIIAPNPGNNICSGTLVLFTATPANGGTPSYQWKVNNVDAGNGKDTFSSSSLTTSDVVTCVMTSTASCVTGSPATSNPVTMTVTNSGVAAVAISASPDSVICSGASVSFTATPDNGGTPTYQWKLNGVNAGTNSGTYTPSGPVNGDKISCIMTSSLACATGSPASSNTITMTVNPSTAASVNISASPDSIICSGTSVIFTANAVGGGTPAYQWKLNGVNAGTNSSTYIPSGLISGDKISCMMTSSLACATGSPATSNTISMTVNSSLPVSVAVTANTPTDTICSGTPVTFTATPSNGGASPSYQWKLNGADVASNGTSYSNSSLTNGSIVSCYLTSNATCISGPGTSSDSVTMAVNPSQPASVTISADSGTSICTGTVATFTATPQYGGTPTYQWKLNGADAGSNSSTYTNGTLANGDKISCVMTSSLTCATGSPTTSDTITMNVNTTQQAAVSISANPGNSICSGTSVAFTAIPQGGGNPAYQWKVNGGNVGANAPSYSDNSLVNSDVVTCVMTSSLSCATGSPATSNAVTMSVVPKAVAGTVSATQNFVCTGTLAVLNDNGASGGNYQWQSSPDSITGFGSINGATSASYTSSPLTKSTYYRTVVSNNSCADTSLSYKITVSPPPTATFSASVSGKIVTFNITNSSGVTSYFWNFGDGTTDTSASPTHTYDSVKTYDVCLTARNASDCNDFICQNVTTFPTGINEITNLTDWQVYPDPFSNQLYISSGSTTGYVVRIEVYDILGRNVLLKNINGIMDNPTILDVSNLRSGVYYLRVTTLNNNFVKPVVKQ